MSGVHACRFGPPLRFSRWMAVVAALPVGRLFIMRLYHYAGRRLRPNRSAVTYFDAAMTCDTRDFIQATIAHFGAWEPNVSAAMERLVEPGDTVVDIGANVGYFTLLLSTLVGPQGKVIAIEAHPEIAAANRANLDRNAVTNVRLISAAVTDEVGEVTLYEGPATNIGSTSIMAERGGRGSIQVPGRPLFEHLSGEQLDRISLVKIDIEGAEVPVVRQLLDRIDDFGERFSMLVEAGVAADPRWRDLFDRFVAKGFCAYAIPNAYEWSRHFDRSVHEPRPIAVLDDNVVELLLTRLPLRQS